MVGLSHSIGVECWARLSTRYGPGCECAGELLLKMSLVLLLCNACLFQELIQLHRSAMEARAG